MTESNPCRIVVLISGNGTNLQAIIDATVINNTTAGNIAGKVLAVIANKADAFGLIRASNAGIPQHLLEHAKFSSRKAFDDALMDTIDSYQPDLIVLAGFMRILGSNFVQKYHGMMLNIHPSLLPKYQGLHTHRRALEAKDKFHGVSIHFVTEELDGGPIVAQDRITIDADDTELTLSKRVQQLEYKLYPEVINWFCSGRLNLTDCGAELDNKAITINC